MSISAVNDQAVYICTTYIFSVFFSSICIFCVHFPFHYILAFEAKREEENDGRKGATETSKAKKLTKLARRQKTAEIIY